MATKTTAGSKRKLPESDDVPEIGEMWERIPGEGPKEYAAFCLYRDLGPFARSIRKAHELAPRARGGSTEGVRRFEGWSVQHYWVSRAQQYDDHVDRLRRIEAEIAVREMAQRHAAAAKDFVQKAIDALATVVPKDLPYRDIIRYFDVATRIERISRGEPGDLDELAEGATPQESVRELMSSSPAVAHAMAEALAAVHAEERRRDREAA